MGHWAGPDARDQVEDALASGAVDMIGLARALVLHPDLPNNWAAAQMPNPDFPRFKTAPEGGITAWYTMRLTQIAADAETSEIGDLQKSLIDYESRDAVRTKIWQDHFSPKNSVT